MRKIIFMEDKTPKASAKIAIVHDANKHSKTTN